MPVSGRGPGICSKTLSVVNTVGTIADQMQGRNRQPVLWDYNINIPPEIAEIEAESFAHLVSMRHGLESNSERHLSSFRIPADIHLPFSGLNGVLRATDYIEKMGERRWKKPLKKPKAQAPAVRARA